MCADLAASSRHPASSPALGPQWLVIFQMTNAKLPAMIATLIKANQSYAVMLTLLDLGNERPNGPVLSPYANHGNQCNKDANPYQDSPQGRRLSQEQADHAANGRHGNQQSCPEHLCLVFDLLLEPL